LYVIIELSFRQKENIEDTRKYSSCKLSIFIFTHFFVSKVSVHESKSSSTKKIAVSLNFCLACLIYATVNRGQPVYFRLTGHSAYVIAGGVASDFRSFHRNSRARAEAYFDGTKLHGRGPSPFRIRALNMVRGYRRFQTSWPTTADCTCTYVPPTFRNKNSEFASDTRSASITRGNRYTWAKGIEVERKSSSARSLCVLRRKINSFYCCEV